VCRQRGLGVPSKKTLFHDFSQPSDGSESLVANVHVQGRSHSCHAASSMTASRCCPRYVSISSHTDWTIPELAGQHHRSLKSPPIVCSIEFTRGLSVYPRFSHLLLYVACTEGAGGLMSAFSDLRIIVFVGSKRIVGPSESHPAPFLRRSASSKLCGTSDN
jgi:hypothetical protein